MNVRVTCVRSSNYHSDFERPCHHTLDDSLNPVNYPFQLCGCVASQNSATSNIPLDKPVVHSACAFAVALGCCACPVQNEHLYIFFQFRPVFMSGLSFA